MSLSSDGGSPSSINLCSALNFFRASCWVLALTVFRCGMPRSSGPRFI